MDKLGFVHQKFIFHLSQNILNKITTFLNKNKIKFKKEYEKKTSKRFWL